MSARQIVTYVLTGFLIVKIILSLSTFGISCHNYSANARLAKAMSKKLFFDNEHLLNHINDEELDHLCRYESLGDKSHEAINEDCIQYFKVRDTYLSAITSVRYERYNLTAEFHNYQVKSSQSFSCLWRSVIQILVRALVLGGLWSGNRRLYLARIGLITPSLTYLYDGAWNMVWLFDNVLSFALSDNTSDKQFITYLFPAFQNGEKDSLSCATVKNINAFDWTYLVVHMFYYCLLIYICFPSNEGLDPEDETDKKLFLDYCKNGRVDLMKNLLKKYKFDKFDINARDSRGQTGLHLSLQENHFSVFKELVDRKANVNLVNDDNELVLHIAVRQGKQNFIKKLIKCKKLDWSLIDKKAVLKSLVEKRLLDEANYVAQVSGNNDHIIKKLIGYCGTLQSNIKYLKNNPGKKEDVKAELELYRLDLLSKLTNEEGQEQGEAAVDNNDQPEEDNMHKLLYSLKSFFECHVCLNPFAANIKIGSCINDHWMCKDCYDQIDVCGICRVSLGEMRRRYTVEQLAELLNPAV